MIEHRLKASFDKYLDAPLEAWRQFASFCDLVQFKKNEIIKPAGAAERYGYFILSGSGGIFLWDDDKYICLDLMFEDTFFADYMSLITRQPSPLVAMVLEPSEMLRISRDNIKRLKETPMGQVLFLISAEYSFVEKQQQQIDLLLKTAEQRYLDLLNKQPDIVRRTPQKYLASYLGVTTQSLSRIRKKIVRS